jgi:hypothetical protein
MVDALLSRVRHYCYSDGKIRGAAGTHDLFRAAK